MHRLDDYPPQHTAAHRSPISDPQHLVLPYAPPQSIYHTAPQRNFNILHVNARTNSSIIRSAFAEITDTVAPHHSAAFGEDSDSGVGSMLGDTQASVNPTSQNLSRKRQRSKLSTNEGLKAVQAAALSLVHLATIFINLRICLLNLALRY